MAEHSPVFTTLALAAAAADVFVVALAHARTHRIESGSVRAETKDGIVSSETKSQLPTFAFLMLSFFLSFFLSFSLPLPLPHYLSLSMSLSQSLSLSLSRSLYFISSVLVLSQCPMSAAAPALSLSLSLSLYFVIAVSAAGSLLLSFLGPPIALLARAMVAPSSEDADEISYAADVAVVCLSGSERARRHSVW